MFVSNYLLTTNKTSTNESATSATTKTSFYDLLDAEKIKFKIKTSRSKQPAEVVQEQREYLPSAYVEFIEWMHKTPAEKAREAILRRLGITEEELEDMELEERERIEEYIAQEMEEEVKRNIDKKIHAAEKKKLTS